MFARALPRTFLPVAGASAFGLAAAAAVASSSRTDCHAGEPPRAARFAGKTVMITGGGGTFGRVGAMYFVKQGANVVLVDFNEKALDASLAAVRKEVGHHASITGTTCDVRNPEAVEASVRAAVSAYGTIDLLWNNAGYQGQIKPLLEYSTEDFQVVMDINVVGAFNMLKAVAKVMAENGGGSIVNTSSVAGLRGTPAMPAYVTSKGAVHGLTMNAAKDLAPYNIRVNSVSPALIGPENGFMWKRQNELHASSGSPYFARDPAVVAANKLKGVPMKRLGTVEEVVQTVAFLLSDDASYTTGTNAVVAGGMA